MGLLKALRVFTGGVAAVALLLSSACALNLPPIRVDASLAELDRLVGEWVGEYQSDDYLGRGGSIVFILDAGQHFARGDVLMTPRGSGMPFERYAPERPERLPAGRTLGMTNQSLTVLFVRADNGELFGELDPYWDPDRQCQARTSFRGALVGDAMRGTYETSYSAPRAKTTGHWRVTRLRQDAPIR